MSMYSKSYADMSKLMDNPELLSSLSSDKIQKSGLAVRKNMVTEASSLDIDDPSSGLNPAPELAARFKQYRKYSDNASTAREAMIAKINKQKDLTKDTSQIKDVTSSSDSLMPKPDKGTSIVDFIKDLEGFKEKAYWDVKQYTIGYGTKARSENETITEEEALERLNDELKIVEKDVRELEKDYDEKFTDSQFKALMSFRYNAGKGNLNKLSDNGTRGIDEIGDMLLEYVYAGKKKLPGLVKRRQKEYELFNEGN